MLRLRSLRAKLILLLVPIVAAGIAAMTLVAVDRSGDAQREQVEDRIQALAAQEANDFDATAREAAAVGRTLATGMTGYRGVGRDDIRRSLEQVLAASPHVAGVYVGFPGRDFDRIDKPFAPYWSRLDGIPALRTIEDVESTDAFRLARDSEADAVLEPHLADGSLIAGYVSPVFRRGIFVGIAGADIVLDEFDRAVSRVHVLDSGYAFAVSNDGTFVSAPDKNAVGRRTLLQLARTKESATLELVAKAMHAGQRGIVETTDPFRGDRRVLVAYAPVSTGKWGLLVVAPVDEAYAGARSLRTTLVALGALALLLLCIAIVLVAGRVTRPVGAFVARLQSLNDRDVAELRSGMEAMARGDLTVEAHATTEPV